MEGSSVSEYRKFLFSLCEEITEGNLHKLKYLCLDRLTTRELEEINTATNLFKCLEIKQEIRKDNLNLLEDLLTQIGRYDLVEKLKEFKSGRSFDCGASGSIKFQVDDDMEDVPDAAEPTANVAGDKNDPTALASSGSEEIMLRDVSADVFEELGFLLNPSSFKSWKILAGKLGYTLTHVTNFKLCPMNSTQMLLQDWSHRGDATVLKLYQTLMNIGREDAAQKLKRILFPSRGTL